MCPSSQCRGGEGRPRRYHQYLHDFIFLIAHTTKPRRNGRKNSPVNTNVNRYQVTVPSNITQLSIYAPLKIIKYQTSPEWRLSIRDYNQDSSEAVARENLSASVIFLSPARATMDFSRIIRDVSLELGLELKDKQFRSFVKG